VDPDLPLMQALQAGDDSALNELIKRHREPLFHFVLRYLRNEILGREVVQETFVRVYFKAKRFEPRSTVKTWIYTIALNLCRDQSRRSKKQQREISLDAPGAGDLPSLVLEDAALSPGEQAGQRDRFGVLQRAIDRLPDKLKAALVLFSLQGCSQQEAADILGTTPKTVETRVYQAKDKLRKLIGTSL
jgi:RNA polymerase sigma-70 factor (ECF subfamily)